MVTGAGGGIGEAYAKGLAEEGARVVVAEIEREGGERVAREISEAGGWAIFVETDVADEASTKAMAAAAVEACGGGGAIVNQSSTAAWMGIGFYGIAKLAMHGLTHSLARELGSRNIRVNAIAPGPTDTEATRRQVHASILEGILSQMPLRRMGEPADMLGALKFLLSDDARWITGHILNVDGGQVMRV